MKELENAAKRLRNAKRYGAACGHWAFAMLMVREPEFPRSLLSLMETLSETLAQNH